MTLPMFLGKFGSSVCKNKVWSTHVSLKIYMYYQNPYIAKPSNFLKCLGGQVVSIPDFEPQGPRLESWWKQNSTHNCMALHCTEPFIITPPLSPYDLNNVERSKTPKLYPPTLVYISIIHLIAIRSYHFSL